MILWKNLGIELLLGRQVVSLDASSKTITLNSGESFNFDDAIVCSGSSAFNIPVPGHDFVNVFTLRDPEDAHKIDEISTGKENVVIIGTGFIGLEAATYFKQNKKIKNVTCVSLDKLPLDRIVGDRLGAIFKKIHEDAGVVMKLGVHLSRYEGADGKVSAVVLEEGGERIPADLVIVGAGVRLNTGFLKNVALQERERSVLVDEYLRAESGIYAAGDIARFKNLAFGGETTRIEHWNVAMNQGRVAALNILGKKVPFTQTPYFWTVQFGGSIRYVGHAVSFDEVIVDGKPEEDKKFAAYICKRGKVLAVCTFGRDPIASAAGELLRENRMPLAEEIRSGKIDILKLVTVG